LVVVVRCSCCCLPVVLTVVPDFTRVTFTTTLLSPFLLRLRLFYTCLFVSLGCFVTFTFCVSALRLPFDTSYTVVLPFRCVSFCTARLPFSFGCLVWLFTRLLGVVHCWLGCTLHLLRACLLRLIVVVVVIVVYCCWCWWYSLPIGVVIKICSCYVWVVVVNIGGHVLHCCIIVVHCGNIVLLLLFGICCELLLHTPFCYLLLLFTILFYDYIPHHYRPIC